MKCQTYYLFISYPSIYQTMFHPRKRPHVIWNAPSLPVLYIVLSIVCCINVLDDIILFIQRFNFHNNTSNTRVLGENIWHSIREFLYSIKVFQYEFFYIIIRCLPENRTFSDTCWIRYQYGYTSDSLNKPCNFYLLIISSLRSDSIVIVILNSNLIESIYSLISWYSNSCSNNMCSLLLIDHIIFCFWNKFLLVYIIVLAYKYLEET